jgi:GNAT superfamily N-acetyltransferase
VVLNKNPDKDVCVRAYTPGDEKSAVELISAVFPSEFTTFTVDWWTWKYKTNPNGFWGDKGDVWVAESDDKIVGYYAIIPYKIKYHQKTIIAAQSVDTATHPNYRGLGIFTRLAKKVYESAGKRYPFIFGFPSEMAHQGFIKLGWKDLCPVSWHEKILNYDHAIEKTIGGDVHQKLGKPILKAYVAFAKTSSYISKVNTIGESVKVETVTEFDNDIDSFWEKTQNDFSVIVERDKSYLNWRFSRNFGNYTILVARKINNSEIVGYMVLRKRKDTFDIVDLVTSRKQTRAAQILIQNALVEAKTEEADSINCWTPKWHENATLLKKAGFISMIPLLRMKRKYLSPMSLYDYGAAKLSNIDKDWFYTCGDTDYL